MVSDLNDRKYNNNMNGMEWMKNKTQYIQSFYGKLIDLAAMKLTSSLWCFLAVIFTIFLLLYLYKRTNNRPREVRRHQTVEWRGIEKYIRMLYYIILSRTMAEKNIHEFTLWKKKKNQTTRKHLPSWTQWKWTVERKRYRSLFFLSFFFSRLLLYTHPLLL